MIPKIIHYCWLSKEPYPEDIEYCISTWREKLPDYQFICWSTDNFNVDIIPYTSEAFREKKWAFVSDYIRLYALYNYGGIYLDSDIEVLKKFDDLLNNRAFTCFENQDWVAAWIFGSEAGNPLFKEFMDDYNDRHFVLEDGSYDMTPNPRPITKRLVEHGLQLINEKQELQYITIYPMDYFCPFNPMRVPKEIFTENTYANHHFSGAWKTEEDQYYTKLRAKFGYIKGGSYVAKFISAVKFRGLLEAIKVLSKWYKRKKGKK